jgi:hypothetical protein
MRHTWPYAWMSKAGRVSSLARWGPTRLRQCDTRSASALCVRCEHKALRINNSIHKMSKSIQRTLNECNSDKWVHLAVTIDLTDDVTAIYQDGTILGSFNNSTNPAVGHVEAIRVMVRVRREQRGEDMWMDERRCMSCPCGGTTYYLRRVAGSAHTVHLYPNPTAPPPPLYPE